MIPLQLQIKNFLSYGPEIQTIDFSSYHLICLSGKNGHGKSALLDAITWSLWGHARKIMTTSRADQGLLRLGQTNMLVVYDFIFNDATYRVRREFSNYYNKPQLNLDFGLLDVTKQELIPLTEKTIRDTQAKIDRLLNLDYDSFINSAFLRQGSSNEFSKKSPSERKQVLATILGLDHYEHLRKQASDKAKMIIADKVILASLHAKNTQDILHYPEIKSKRRISIDALTQVIEQEKVCVQVHEQFSEKKRFYLEKKQQASVIEFQTKHLEEQEQQQLVLLRTTLQAWKQLHRKLLSCTMNTTDVYAEREKIAAALRIIQEHMSQQLHYQQQVVTKKESLYVLTVQLQETSRIKLQEHTQAIHGAMHELQRCAQMIVEHTARHTHLVEEQALLQKKIDDLQLNHKHSASISERLDREVAQFEKRKAVYQLWIAQGNWLTTEQKSIHEKQKLAQDEANPSCPLCEQHLSISRKRFLKQTFVKRVDHLAHRIARLQKVTQNLKKILVTQHEAIIMLKQKHTEFVHSTLQLQELYDRQEKQHKLVQESSSFAGGLNIQKLDLENKVTQVELNFEVATADQKKAMHEDVLYKQELAALQELEKNIATVPYDAGLYTTLCEQLKSIDNQIADRSHSHEFQTTKQRHAQTIKDTCTLIASLRAQKKLHLAKQELHLKDAQQLQEIVQQDSVIEEKLRYYADQKNKLLEEKGRLDNEYEKLGAVEQELTKQKTLLDEYEVHITDYQTIAHATSKEGIQALLIEDAIPEIEQEANHLLARLTNNQAQIFIESLRDLKKGGTKETLDIKISDAVGIRPYELFSGGEAFRIDFALRIALSKLLARRAGTSLQTLIIDEGFGSQDEEGLSNIMEAIYKIQDDFAKIIIVSHLDTMKNQFPVHMHVEKGANGSKVTVIEQG